MGALRVLSARSGTIRIAEVKFGKVAMKMFLTSMLAPAGHATFEDRIVAFHCVRVDLHAVLRPV